MFYNLEEGAYMSNINFPANYSIDLFDLNIEMMQYYSKEWNLEHLEMGRGQFKGYISAIHTPRIQLGYSFYSKRVMCKGDFPDGCVVLLYARNNVRYNFHNRIIDRNEIVLLTNGDEIDILTDGETEAHTIVVEEQLFYQTYYDYFGDTPDKIIKNKRFFIKPGMLSLIHKTVDLWKTYLTKEYTKMNVKPSYDKIELEILHQFFSCIITDFSPTKRNKFDVKKIRNLLHVNIEKDVRVFDIATELGISESQMHNAFKKEYGLTPKKYLQNLRFNAVKNDLQSAHRHLSTVKEIAQKYHFYHMGHFTMEYQKIFVQKPSETLNTKFHKI